MQLLIFIAVYPLLFLISRLSFPLLYALSDGISLLNFRFLKYRIKVIRKNIELAFPEKNAQEVEDIIRAYYTHMSDVFLEMIKSIGMGEKSMRKRFIPKNIEALTQFYDQKRGAIIICGHYSSWEWMMSLGYHMKAPGYGIYTPLENSYFDRLVRRIRKKHNAFLISRYEVKRTLEQHFNNKIYGVYGFASDQSPRPRPKTYWRTFLGVPVPVFTGAEDLAKKYNLGIVFADIQRIKRGYYEVYFRLLTDDPNATAPREITDTFTDWLETQIRTDPNQYLWSHNRFKHRHKAPQEVLNSSNS